MLPNVFRHRVGNLVAHGLAGREDAPQFRCAEIHARAVHGHHRAGCDRVRETFRQHIDAISRPARTLNHCEPAQLQDTIGLLPAVELVKHIGTDDEVEVCALRVGRSQFPEGVHRVGCAGALNLTVRHAEVGVVRSGQLHHAQAVGSRGDALPGLEPGFAGRDEQDGLQPQRDAGGFGDEQVAQVRRVEGAAQDADASARWFAVRH